jgi:hypothetical protein
LIVFMERWGNSKDNSGAGQDNSRNIFSHKCAKRGILYLTKETLLFLKNLSGLWALPDHHHPGVEMITRYKGDQAPCRMESRSRKEGCKLSGHSPVVS